MSCELRPTPDIRWTPSHLTSSLGSWLNPATDPFPPLAGVCVRPRTPPPLGTVLGTASAFARLIASWGHYSHSPRGPRLPYAPTALHRPRLGRTDQTADHQAVPKRSDTRSKHAG